MNDLAIQVSNISKSFRLGEAEPYKMLRDVMVRAVKAPLRWMHAIASGAGARRRDEDDTLWALRDVSFELERGQVLGVIGRNGAGKSTLLKILSRITEPTEGQIDIYGRVGSLLEVGTGFHPELTGRENIFMNGAILGMTRREIASKFDQIVEFAGIERFIHTPVKRYSSGMYVRLAFAVAAHLEPEILIVDEVLAVGDAEFQRKCLGRMNEVASHGRTVLFVSHNLAAVSSLCTKGLLLDKGQVHFYGSAEDAISRYVQMGDSQEADVDLASHPGRPGKYSPFIKRFRVRDSQGNVTRTIPLGEDVTFELEIESPQPLSNCHVNIRLFGGRAERLMTCYTKYQREESIEFNRTVHVACTIRDLRLMPGPYHLGLLLVHNGDTIDEIESGLSFEITPADVYGTGKMMPGHAGVIAPDVVWSIESDALLPRA
jgi:lipopolysaccharide transport system ATP-binding protein